MAVLDEMKVVARRVGRLSARLDGSMNTEQRQRALRDFDFGGPAFALLLSKEAGGSGLNLHMANVLIIFEPSWNPAVDEPDS